jgi:hypothetical protein
LTALPFFDDDIVGLVSEEWEEEEVEEVARTILDFW